MITHTSFQIIPLSMVTRDGLQRIDIRYRTPRSVHANLSVYRDGSPIVTNTPVALNSGTGTVSVLLPEQKKAFSALWVLKAFFCSERPSLPCGY